MSVEVIRLHTWWSPCTACAGVGCSLCEETGLMSEGQMCRCGDAESRHYRGECVAVKGSAWRFCPCEQFAPRPDHDR